jgi:hypothetical protein
MNRWKIFFWAMLHSPEFKYCDIHLPIRFVFRKVYSVPSGYGLELQLRPLSVYVPWCVERAYLKVHNSIRQDDFDDIPF